MGKSGRVNRGGVVGTPPFDAHGHDHLMHMRGPTAEILYDCAERRVARIGVYMRYCGLCVLVVLSVRVLACVFSVHRTP